MMSELQFFIEAPMSIFYIVYGLMLLALAEVGLYLLCAIAICVFLYLFMRHMRRLK